MPNCLCAPRSGSARLATPALSFGFLFLALVDVSNATDASVSIGAPPLFYTDKRANSIPFPSSAPPTMVTHIRNASGPKCQAAPSNGRLSGFVLFTDIKERNQAAIPAGNAAIQIVTVKGKRWNFNPATEACDKEEPVVVEIMEYFDNPGGGPSRDHHITVECLVSRYDVRVSVETAIIPLPANVRPFAGWRAGLPFTNAAEKAAIRSRIKANTSAKWGYRYAYDGCHTPPKTPTKTKHYMKYRLSYPGGPSGSVTTTGN